MHWVSGPTGVWFLGEYYGTANEPGARLSQNWRGLGLRMGLGIRYKFYKGRL